MQNKIAYIRCPACRSAGRKPGGLAQADQSGMALVCVACSARYVLQRARSQARHALPQEKVDNGN